MNNLKTFFTYDSCLAGKEIATYKLFLKLLEPVKESCSLPLQSLTLRIHIKAIARGHTFSG